MSKRHIEIEIAQITAEICMYMYAQSKSCVCLGNTVKDHFRTKISATGAVKLVTVNIIKT